MKSKAEIIVLIPHYNRPKALLNSIKSIREDIAVDVMVVDDGSQQLFEETEIAEAYPKGNIYFEYLEENSGVGIASNQGLKRIQEMSYPYIARLDCGDLFYANKLTKQLAYLKTNPDIKLLGTWVNFIDPEGNALYQLKPPVSYPALKRKMYINCMFIQPTVVFESSILDEIGLYPTKYHRNAEDYAFFFNIINKYKAENYPEILLDCIVQENSLSTESRKEQVVNRLKIIWDNFHFGFYPIYGLLRNFPLLFTSRKFVNRLKRIRQSIRQ